MSYDFQESARWEEPYHKFQGQYERLNETTIANYFNPVSLSEGHFNICISQVDSFYLVIDGEFVQPLGDLQSFENEWLEVEVKHPTGWRQSMPASPSSEMSSSPKVTPKFLCPVLEELCQEAGEGDQEWRVPLYKHTHLEIDINAKSDRIEWGHARYQSVYRVDRAFELVVQWVTASGTIVADLIMGWSRKAQTCGLQMIPIPADPLALPFTHKAPFTHKSDPLRGPIFVPLDTECLMGEKSYLFEEFPEETWDQRLFLFQEAIIENFGFIRCIVESSNVSSPTSNSNSSSTLAHQHQYVHLTGNMFILIPSQPCQRPHHRSNSLSHVGRFGFGNRQLGIQSSRRYPVHSDALSSPHEEYITRHVSGKSKDDDGADMRVGFLWSWNHMVSRRWKSSSTPATGDEVFQTKILRDFREFCANNDNHLKSFWDSCWALREQS